MIVTLGGYTAYFDASKPKTRMMVAGFVSTLAEWAQFEIAWRLILAKHDVPYFHMKEFNAHQGAFRHPKWQSNHYRNGFMDELITCVLGWTAACIGSGMRQELFDEYNVKYELDKRFNAYAICGRDCAAQVRSYIRKEINSDLPIAFIFDRGDEGQGFLKAEMEASELPSPAFKRSRPDPKLDIDDPYHVQLQACDLAAWELQRGVKDAEAGKKDGGLRTSLRRLAAMKHIWKETKESDLQGLIQVAGIREREKPRC